MNTKKLWQDLHYPYGNYTSFFRHLILLEKYWRSGDIGLAPNASLKSSAYLRSVQNRITAYEGKQNTADLSVATRPDLEAPPAPTLTHVPGEEILASLPSDLPSPVIPSPTPSSTGKETPISSSKTILQIPRVYPLSPNSILSPESLALTQANANHSASKIRVRQDLMNQLGLIPRAMPPTSIVVSSSTPLLMPSTTHSNMNVTSMGNTNSLYPPLPSCITPIKVI